MDSQNCLLTASIASGSNGNCYYIGNEQEAILVDAGISCRELERRMMRMGLSMDRIRAIFISHEHTDHIKGLAVVANKYQLPVFMTEKTLDACRLAIPSRLIHLIPVDHHIQIGNLTVIPFRKYHDAADAHSFVIRQGSLTVGVFTDLGRVCEPLTHYFGQCDVAFLETNYDEDMLDQGRYPYYLKNRIRSGFGHLSNREAHELFIRHRHPGLRLLFLSHLSRDNNDPHLVMELFQRNAGQIRIVLAGRDSETAVYRITEQSQEGTNIKPEGEHRLFPSETLKQRIEVLHYQQEIQFLNVDKTTSLQSTASISHSETIISVETSIRKPDLET